MLDKQSQTAVLDSLPATDRQTVASLAAAAGVSTAALLPEIVSAYLRLLSDVPAALPRDPMAGLSAAAMKREGRRNA